MVKSNFREWTLDKIDEAFGTKANLKGLPALDELLSFDYSPTDYEKRFLNDLKKKYSLGGEDWNEVELENKIISPLFVFADIDNQDFAYFLQRELHVVIDEYELSGRVDGMIATGYRNPKIPFFCMNEYKRATDPNGDPKGQALIAMLTAQALNNNALPIYGCYIVGRTWVFMVLEAKAYAFSEAFTVDNDDIFDIYRVLKSLKFTIEKSLLQK